MKHFFQLNESKTEVLIAGAEKFPDGLASALGALFSNVCAHARNLGMVF